MIFLCIISRSVNRRERGHGHISQSSAFGRRVTYGRVDTTEAGGHRDKPPVGGRGREAGDRPADRSARRAKTDGNGYKTYKRVIKWSRRVVLWLRVATYSYGPAIT